MIKQKKFNSDINLNKSSVACSPCKSECEKINKRLNQREIKKIKSKEVPHILKVFNF